MQWISWGWSGLHDVKGHRLMSYLITAEELEEVIKKQREFIATGDLKFDYDNEALSYLDALDFVEETIDEIKWNY